MSPPKSRKEAILDTVAELVQESGAAHVTLDAVCAKANVSKGGLLYHFCSKEAMFLALLERLKSMMENARESEIEKLPPGPARELKSHIIGMELLWSKKARSIGTALLAVGANDPGLLKQIGDDHREMVERMASTGLSREFIRVIMLASLGWHLAQMLGLSAFTEEERKNFITELLRLVDEKEAPLCN